MLLFEFCKFCFLHLFFCYKYQLCSLGFPGCGGSYTQDNAEIRSPSNKGEYPPDMHCEYKIKLPINSRIKLTFLEFSLEDSSECQFDYVAVSSRKCYQFFVMVFNFVNIENFEKCSKLSVLKLFLILLGVSFFLHVIKLYIKLLKTVIL